MQNPQKPRTGIPPKETKAQGPRPHSRDLLKQGNSPWGAPTKVKPLPPVNLRDPP